MIAGGITRVDTGRWRQFLTRPQWCVGDRPLAAAAPPPAARLSNAPIPRAATGGAALTHTPQIYTSLHHLERLQDPLQNATRCQA